MNWYVGQKVVCVKVDPYGLLSMGAVYTVTEVAPSSCGCLTIGVGITYYGPGVTKSGEPGYCNVCGADNSVINSRSKTFWVGRFRPLDLLSEQMDRIETEGAPIEEPQPELA